MERIHIRDQAVLVHDIKRNRQRLEKTSVSFFIVTDLDIFLPEPFVFTLEIFYSRLHGGHGSGLSLTRLPLKYTPFSPFYQKEWGCGRPGASLRISLNTSVHGDTIMQQW